MLVLDLDELVAYASARGARVGLNTNATLLTEQRAERLVDAGLDWLHVSLDGATAETYESIRDGARFARVVPNGGLEHIVAVRARRAASSPSVWIVFVAMRRNVEESADVVRLAARLGVDGVRVQNLSHSFSDTDPVGDDAESDEARASADGCDWPWRAPYVTHDGLVRPCCMVMGADRAVLGDLDREPLPVVWRGPAYRRFREALLSDDPPPVCRGCSMYRGVFRRRASRCVVSAAADSG